MDNVDIDSIEVLSPRIDKNNNFYQFYRLALNTNQYKENKDGFTVNLGEKKLLYKGMVDSVYYVPSICFYTKNSELEELYAYAKNNFTPSVFNYHPEKEIIASLKHSPNKRLLLDLHVGYNSRSCYDYNIIVPLEGCKLTGDDIKLDGRIKKVMEKVEVQNLPISKYFPYKDYIFMINSETGTTEHYVEDIFVSSPSAKSIKKISLGTIGHKQKVIIPLKNHLVIGGEYDLGKNCLVVPLGKNIKDFINKGTALKNFTITDCNYVAYIPKEL